jgi:hypothetical protein
MASSSAETPEKKAPAPSSASSPSAKDGDASLIDDETQELLDQGITGHAIIGYPARPTS